MKRGRSSPDEPGLDGHHEDSLEDSYEELPPHKGEPEEPNENSPVSPPGGGGGFFNDRCESALQLMVDSTISSSTAGVAPTPEYNTCLPEMSLGFSYNANVVWFSMEGNGEGITLQVDADFEYMISVYAGDSCDKQSCLTTQSPDDYIFDMDDITGSAGNVTFLSQPGTIYFIAVEQRYGDGQAFTLEIKGGGETPPNNVCTAAETIPANQQIKGSTTFSIPHEGLECHFNHTSPGVWYTIEGTDELWLFAATGFDTQLSLFEGQTCDELVCLERNDDFYYFLDLDIVQNSAIVRYLEAGKTYFLLLDGYSANSGDFTLITEIQPLAANSDCANAESLELDAMASGNTLTAAHNQGLPYCGPETNETSAGLFYSVKGTGGPMVVTAESDSLVALAVYGGECGALTCVESSEDSPPTIFESEADKEYLIYAFGSGAFNITVEGAERPPNDLCSEAIALEIDGEPVLGDTTASLSEVGLNSCGAAVEIGAGGVWYSFVGNGETLLLGVDTDSPDSTYYFDAQMTLYAGTCGYGGLICLDGNDESPEYSSLGFRTGLLIETEQDIEYHVLVHGFFSSRGLFEISLQSIEEPPNPTCEEAIVLELEDTAFGSTVFSDGFPDAIDLKCGDAWLQNTTGPGVYYQVEGTGSLMEASVDTTFNTQVVIFSGDDCEELECVDGGYAWGGPSIVWESEVGTIYTIFVSSDWLSDRGEYDLMIQEVEAPENDECEDAISVQAGELVSGSTRYASEVDLLGCGVNVSEPALWYELVPPSAVISDADGVSGFEVTITDHSAEHRISVFAGDDCWALACVTNSTGGVDMSFTDDYWQESLPTTLTEGASVRFEAEPGLTYYIAVSETAGDDPFFRPGYWESVDFELSVATWFVAKK